MRPRGERRTARPATHNTHNGVFSDACPGTAREGANSRQQRTGGATAPCTQAADAPPGPPNGAQSGTPDDRRLAPFRRPGIPQLLSLPPVIVDPYYPQGKVAIHDHAGGRLVCAAGPAVLADGATERIST